MADSTGAATPAESEARGAELTEERVVRLKRLDELTADLSLEEAERAFRAGRGLAKLGRIAEQMRRAAGAIPPDAVDDEDEVEPDLEAVRTRLASELTAVVALAPLDDELDAYAVGSLVEAYVKLGGDLMLAPRPPAPRINPADVDVVNRTAAAAWTAASQPEARPDTIADAVRLTLLEVAK